VSSPFGPLVLIANPKAGRGKVGKMLPEVEKLLRAERLAYRVVHTRGPGHATEAAREALAGDERFVVAAGGDGTVHEVVNGLMDQDRPVAEGAVLGVVACGSGCDFVRTFDLPGDAVKASVHLSGDATRPIDIGKATWVRPDGSSITRYFPNIAEVGLGAATVARASTLPRSLGPSQYFFAFWMTLPGFKPGNVVIDADGNRFESRAHQVVVANARYYGGGMQISPKSATEDGLLDVLVFVGPKSDAFTILPKVYKGSHLPHRNIVELKARRVRVRTEGPSPIEADGEVLGSSTDVTFEAVPTPLLLKV
jgi:YegS/Rv2252/BmrU family lipid kinase